LKPAPKKAAPKKPAVSKPDHGLQWLEVFFTNNSRLISGIAFSLAAIFTILMFDIKISEGNDDSMYIEAGYRYARNFTGYYYTANAPLYPMLLGVVTMFTGINLILFKIINSALFLLHLWIFYHAFRKRIPMIVLFPVLMLAAVNSYFLYYASQTYNEALFLLLQAIFFFVFFRNYDRILSNPSIKASWKYWWGIGLTLFLVTFCKNIAIGALGALILYFLIEKKYSFAIFVTAGYAAVRLPFEAIKSIVWGSSNQYGSQGAILLQKDAYDASKGQENIAGFINRFFQNLDLYISKRFFQILGFTAESSSKVHTILTLFILVLTAFAGWWIFRNRQKPLMLVLCYVSVMLGLIFLVLQVSWDQPRLIMVYVPLVIMTIIYGLYNFLKTKGSFGSLIYLSVVIIITGSGFISTLKKSVTKVPILKKNLQGDIYYGYTPDWKNYLMLSAWCADSLPKNSLVASRKAPMSFVYGKGMEFFPVYSVIAPDSTTNLSNPDSVISYFERNKVTHVILGSLRRNPKKADGYIINTLHRMMEPVARKYPQKLRLVKQMGDSEPAYLYEVR
jgi:hypothetical protein